MRREVERVEIDKTKKQLRSTNGMVIVMTFHAITCSRIDSKLLHLSDDDGWSLTTTMLVLEHTTT